MRVHYQGCITSLESLQHIDRLLWRLPPAKKRLMEPEQKNFFYIFFFQKQTSHDVPWLETNDKRTEMCAVWERPRYTLWRTAQNRAFCAISKHSVVKRLRFDKKIINKCEKQKNTTVLKKLCIQNRISFVEPGKPHEIRCYVWGVCVCRGAYQTPHLLVLTWVTHYKKSYAHPRIYIGDLNGETRDNVSIWARQLSGRGRT